MCGSNNFHQSTPTEPEKSETLEEVEMHSCLPERKSHEENHMLGNSGRPLGVEVLGSKTTWKRILPTTNKSERGSKALLDTAAPGNTLISACRDTKQKTDNSHS